MLVRRESITFRFYLFLMQPAHIKRDKLKLFPLENLKTPWKNKAFCNEVKIGGAKITKEMLELNKSENIKASLNLAWT